MGARGKKSASEEAAPALEKKRPAPPARLTLVQQKRWKEIIDDYPPGHFRPGDLSALESFIVLESHRNKLTGVFSRAKTDTKAVRDYKDTVKLMMAVGAKLRLFIQQTIRSESASVSKPGGKRPWER